MAGYIPIEGRSIENGDVVFMSLEGGGEISDTYWLQWTYIGFSNVPWEKYWDDSNFKESLPAWWGEVYNSTKDQNGNYTYTDGPTSLTKWLFDFNISNLNEAFSNWNGTKEKQDFIGYNYALFAGCMKK